MPPAKGLGAPNGRRHSARRNPQGERFAVAVMGRDRPGIVAAVTGLFAELGCNLADVATSILGGHFAMMLVFTAPKGHDPDEIRARLEPLGESLGLMTSLWPVDGESLESDRPNHVLSVYGPDRLGIVHAVSEVLSRWNVNICDMTCRIHDRGVRIYVVAVEVDVPPDVPTDELSAEISKVTRQLGLEASLRPIQQVIL
jgi:glycine cleavage system transcriptional repressor